LIYRNTDNVFAYTDDYALFPHMPFNTPGYDPRAKEILGDWMVSIPAVRKSPQIVEYAYQVDSDPVDNIGSPVVDTNPQPYVEVLPGQPGYGAAVLAAQQRLETFHTGITSSLPLLGPPYVRYADPGQTADILDPAVVADPVCHPIPTGDPTVYDTPLAEHPDWVITDLTQPPGPYTPRQPDWMSILVQNQPAQENLGCASTAAAAAAYADELDAIKLVQSAGSDPDVRDHAHPVWPLAAAAGLRLLVAAHGGIVHRGTAAALDGRREPAGQRPGVLTDTRRCRVQDDLHQLPRTGRRGRRSAGAEPGHDDRRQRDRGRLARRDTRPGRRDRGG
jgi:hypothetical protein